MENRQTTKTITIKDRTYQLNKLDARTSCWLFAFLGEKAGSDSFTTAFGRCTREQFMELENIALRQIFWIDTKEDKSFPTALLSAGGAFTIPELETDADIVFQLVTASILFSISPFLTVAESNSPTPKT